MMFNHQLRRCPLGLLVPLIAIGLLWCVWPTRSALAQLQTLSAGDADRQWREAQLQALDRQLADTNLPEELKREITAQRAWLDAWDPKPAARKAPGQEAPSGDAESGAADNKKDQKGERLPGKENRRGKEQPPMKEPIIDPNGRAKELRERLFDPERPATSADTKALQNALSDHSGDVGLRQLQLHWIDQPTYRDTLWKEIGNAADRVLALLSDQPASEETKAAAAFANYRKARALAHALAGRPLRGTKVAGVDKLSADQREQMQNAIGECWRQIETLVGTGHPEFFQLEIYSLRRYGWSGQALELLERHAEAVDEVAYLTERQAILESLGWTAPAEQTAAQAKARDTSGDSNPKQTFEIQFVPLPAADAQEKK